MVWRKLNSELEMKILTPSVKHDGGSQMVLGCMSAVGVGNLHFIDGMMDKYMYLDILKQNLKQSAEKLAYCHICRLWALYLCPQVIKTAAHSPDLNPIENIWDHLHTEFVNLKFTAKMITRV
ncbi:hypothetical protein AVEN_236413-1 [Araneus ventricosus]|uniref:Tc1-like transposase DDE domain-containing protein n=1 Tax=Araneus ventricosus TaxID=182803 RepID=A0A4Y2IU60_ARAVE|nr:hypothetical protein AVEN_236413-1 [Araneus ventricosus]